MIMGPVSAQRWCYACAKQLVERLIYAHGQQNGLQFAIVRPYNWIGPRMDYVPGVDGKDDGLPRVLASFMTALMKGDPLVLVNSGEVRDDVEMDACDPHSEPAGRHLPSPRQCTAPSATSIPHRNPPPNPNPRRCTAPFATSTTRSRRWRA